LVMLVFHIVTSFLFLFGVSDTILQNGDNLQHGKSYLLFFLIHLTVKPGLKTNMNYSTSGMPKHEMSSSIFSVYSNKVFGSYFLHYNTPLKFNHVFQQHWLRFIISSEFMIHKQRHTLLEMILIMHLGDFIQVMTH
jgi:hypothetical protein